MIPSKMTWALQPADTHLFGQLKSRLGHHCIAAAAGTESGNLTVLMLLECLKTTILEKVSSQSWSKAFSDLGLIGTQRHVSKRVRTKLNLDRIEEASRDLPTLADLQSCFPKGTVILI